EFAAEVVGSFLDLGQDALRHGEVLWGKAVVELGGGALHLGRQPAVQLLALSGQSHRGVRGDQSSAPQVVEEPVGGGLVQAELALAGEVVAQRGTAAPGGADGAHPKSDLLVRGGAAAVKDPFVQLADGAVRLGE